MPHTTTLTLIGFRQAGFGRLAGSWDASVVDAKRMNEQAQASPAYGRRESIGGAGSGGTRAR